MTKWKLLLEKRNLENMTIGFPADTAFQQPGPPLQTTALPTQGWDHKINSLNKSYPKFSLSFYQDLPK